MNTFTFYKRSQHVWKSEEKSFALQKFTSRSKSIIKLIKQENAPIQVNYCEQQKSEKQFHIKYKKKITIFDKDINYETYPKLVIKTISTNKTG